MQPDPCPFCGGDLLFTHYPGEVRPKWGAVTCLGCGAIGPAILTNSRPADEWWDKAVEAWNKRATKEE